MKLLFWRKPLEDFDRTFPGGPDWYSEPYMSFFDDEVLNHLFNCERGGNWPDSYQAFDERAVAVVSTVGIVIIVSNDAYFLKSLKHQLRRYPYDIILATHANLPGAGVLQCRSQRFADLPPNDGAWAQTALSALAGHN